MYRPSVSLLHLLIVAGFLAPAAALADWQYDAYLGDWSTLPDFDALTPVDSGTVTIISTAPRPRDDRFGLRFRAQVTVDVAGNYTFATNSDDGSQLFIDGALVVDNDGLHGPRTISEVRFLDVGTYDVEVTMFEQGGGQLIEATYAPPGGGFRAIPGGGTLAGPPDLSQTGSWGSVIPWPHVPVSAANLPDGRVITWASNERYSFPGGRPEFTFTGIWDPSDNSVLEIDHPSHDMFCAHQVMLENGQVFVSGGRNSGNSPWTSVFDINTNQWVPLNNMQRGRWYPTSLALADGTVFTAIGSGGGNTGEVYDPNTGNWELLSGIDFNPVILNYPSNQYGERNWWPLFGLMPDGRVFHAGPTPQMHVIDTSGVGSATPSGAEFTDWYPKHGTTVMYDEGKMITAGGWVDGASIVSTNEAHVIDLNGPSPTVTATSPMINPRKFHNGVMLPDGEVLVVGGNTSGRKFNDSGTVYTAEVWNPVTETWRELSAMSVPRNYHSIALLLTDGTVLAAGGGLCNCSADHPNGQIFYPPYLYNADGSLAARPTILTAPSAFRAGDTFEVTADEEITHFSMVKMSSTTHAVNTDLRYLSVPFSGAAGTYQLTAHSNPNVLTPGYWMLFALNANGTPSVSKVVQVRAANDSDPDPVSFASFDFLSFASLSAFQLNGSASGLAGVARLTPASSDLAGSLFYRTPFQLDPTTAFTTSFTFSSSGVADGAEGLTFIVQGNESTTLGESGNGLGYRFVPNSLVVEFDTANNAAGDVSANHVAVHTNGDSETPVASADIPFDLEDGAVHRAWIEYSAANDELSVFLSADPSAPRPAAPVLTLGNLDLVSTVGSLGYFGFSAATGTNTNNHDIHAWSMDVTAGDTPLSIQPMVAEPQPGDGPVSFSALATGVGLEYSWSFGDGTPQTAFSTSPDVSHTYTAPGRYVVTLIVRDINGVEQSIQFIQAVYPPLTAQQPVSSTTIVAESVTGTERVWNVNPDNNTVTVINGETGAKITEIAVGADPRSLTLAPNDTIWVTNKDDATITVVDVNSLSVTSQRSLPPGSRPHGIVAHESSGYVYVTLEQLGVVRKLSINDSGFSADAQVGSDPRHLSVAGDESRLYVSRFISPPFPGEHTTAPQKTTDGTTPAGGEVLAIDPSTMTMLSTIVLGYSERQPAEITGPGFPNYLGPPIISPSGQTAWVPSKQDDILRGLSRNGSPLNHDHTVRAVTSVIDLATETENIGQRVDHDNSSTARNGTFDPNGVFLFVALEGNREVVVIDAFSFQEVLRFDVGFAPQSVATSADGTRVFVHNFMSRSVAIVDTYELMNGLSETVNVMTTVDVTANEALSPEVLLGKQLFYDARDPRLSLESYMSCASCHNDGGHDGRVWDLSSMGEGLRNTISLKGHGGMSHGPLHWSANFDEVQDFENQIRGLAGGTGLMSDADFTATEELLGAPKTGLSADLDALAAYVASLRTIEDSPYRNADGTLTAGGLAGKSIFESGGCADCHSGSRFTDSASGVRHDVGTITAASGSRLGSTEDPITAIDSPTLLGLWATAPYLHDGSAATLQDAVLAHSSAALGGRTFTSAELDSLAEYLRQIDAREVPSIPSTWQNQDIGAVGAAGSLTDTDGTLTLEASGSDIWGPRDEFHFAYQVLDGDGEIVARLVSLSNTDAWAKAGVMMRESLTNNSAHAMMVATPSGNGADMQYRAVTGGGTASEGGGDRTSTIPLWVRLVREGDTFIGYKSTDGSTWVEDARATIPMASTVYAGVMATSHDDGVITTAVFDNAVVAPAVPPVPDTTPPSVPANVNAVATGTTMVSVSWNASTDADSGIGGYQVFRDGVFLIDVSGTSFDDSGLLPSTSYSYTVLAYDAAVPANLSAQSSAALVTTDAEVFVAVPDVAGVAQATAEATLTMTGLTIGSVTSINSDTVAAGNVISQNPLGGASVLEGSAVDLVISLGAAPVAVPDVVGQNVATATTNLNNAGLATGTVTRTYSDTVPLDAVISQDPGSGVLVANGSTVDLVVSDGPVPLDVTPPSVPAGLSATVAGPYQVNLSWSASTDTESGVGGYRVFRDGLSIGVTAGTTYQVTGLSPNTSYIFTVAAFDNAVPANESMQSAAVNATTEIAPTWQNQDIGAVGAAGSLTDTDGTLTLEASGSDIWGPRDEFHFAYQVLDGDGEIVARLVSLSNTDAWAKAGVMMRESLTNNSAHAMMVATPSGNGADMQYRAVTGGGTASEGGGDRTSTIPLWVRLVREGDTFIGYKSTDGSTWVEDARATIPMASTIYAGVMATSHDDGVITTAVFENAEVTPAEPPAP